MVNADSRFVPWALSSCSSNQATGRSWGVSGGESIGLPDRRMDSTY